MTKPKQPVDPKRVERELKADAAKPIDGAATGRNRGVASTFRPRGVVSVDPVGLVPSVDKEKERRLPLLTARHVRLEMARVYRAARFGLIEPAVAARLIYMLGVGLLKAIEIADIEPRLDALERSLGVRRPYEGLRRLTDGADGGEAKAEGEAAGGGGTNESEPVP
jgi:hypothetical protein